MKTLFLFLLVGELCWAGPGEEIERRLAADPVDIPSLLTELRKVTHKEFETLPVETKLRIAQGLKQLNERGAVRGEDRELVRQVTTRSNASILGFVDTPPPTPQQYLAALAGELGNQDPAHRKTVPAGIYDSSVVPLLEPAEAEYKSLRPRPTRSVYEDLIIEHGNHLLAEPLVLQWISAHLISQRRISRETREGVLRLMEQHAPLSTQARASDLVLWDSQPARGDAIWPTFTQDLQRRIAWINQHGGADALMETIGKMRDAGRDHAVSQVFTSLDGKAFESDSVIESLIKFIRASDATHTEKAEREMALAQRLVAQADKSADPMAAHHLRVSADDIASFTMRREDRLRAPQTPAYRDGLRLRVQHAVAIGADGAHWTELFAPLRRRPLAERTAALTTALAAPLPLKNPDASHVGQALGSVFGDSAVERGELVRQLDTLTQGISSSDSGAHSRLTLLRNQAQDEFESLGGDSLASRLRCWLVGEKLIRKPR